MAYADNRTMIPLRNNGRRMLLYITNIFNAFNELTIPITRGCLVGIILSSHCIPCIVEFYRHCNHIL